MASILQQSTAFSCRSGAFTSSTRSQNAARSQGARNVAMKAADRPVWYPGNSPPEWLDGSLPGDYGYDPLGLASDPEMLKWWVQAELVHGRWAMLGTVGMLVPGIAARAGGDFPQWYDAGQVYIENSTIPFGALLMTQVLMMGWSEMMRYYEFVSPGSQGTGSFMGFTDAFAGTGENGYPGGRFFDPFGLAKGDPAKLQEYKVKEIKNGRLAMFSCLGYYAQYAATGKGPVDNWFDHIADPFHNTCATNGVSVPFLN
ncbi:hypothetical protein BSKO_00501 [Bryopsis sp. KO-2023]|nr:hypothetical protein BSKO_00501 [Bryopsis sp. KO-2023]